MNQAIYQLPDEPAPTTLSRFAAEPMLPLLAFMLVGSWFALPWLAFNGFAMGSASRWREALFCLGAPIACALWLALVGNLGLAGLVPGISLKYLLLALPVIKLSAIYSAAIRQQKSLELFKHFGGSVGNGLYILAGGYLVHSQVQAALMKLDHNHLAFLILS